MTSHRPLPSVLTRSQRGTALVVGLLILLVLTIIGISGMHSTTLEEKMTGNMRDQNDAFQAAETALRGAEDYVQNSLQNTGGFDNTGGLYKKGQAPDPFDDATWTGTNSLKYTTTSYSASQPPRYFIELRGQITDDKATQINITNYGQSTGGGAIQMFRIVAMSSGKSGNARVVLEEYYGRRF